jgi:hypothetical protein
MSPAVAILALILFMISGATIATLIERRRSRQSDASKKQLENFDNWLRLSSSITEIPQLKGDLRQKVDTLLKQKQNKDK